MAVEPFWDLPPPPIDPGRGDRRRDAADPRGRPPRAQPTGIGHDAVYMARAVPSALLFIPCHGGVSHNETESITPEWAEAGLAVLADAVLATAGIVGR